MHAVCLGAWLHHAYRGGLCSVWVCGGTNSGAMYVWQNAAQKRRSKQKIIKLQQKHGAAEEASLESVGMPMPIQESPNANQRASDNAYSGGKDNGVRARARPREGAPASGPMRRRLEGAERGSENSNNSFVVASENVSFSNGFSHNQKLSK